MDFEFEYLGEVEYLGKFEYLSEFEFIFGMALGYE
jgi:hypothetical protein